MNIPVRAVSAFPVSLAHAVRRTSWCVHEELENIIASDQVTYQGSDALSGRMRHRLAVLYDTHRNDYYDHIRAYPAAHPNDAKPFQEWPPFGQWCGRAVPSGATLRHRLETVHYSKGTGHAQEVSAPKCNAPPYTCPPERVWCNCCLEGTIMR
mmetsp:Transcript_5709/g.18047  ORF Transcript_5709/g.18047 Transcript_5709/m.18047 type:complete len:153 (-) Transcript_5709:830-1288(-)